MTPEIWTAAGGALGAILAAWGGGSAGGRNALNGFKDEMRRRFDSVDARLDRLVEKDGEHEIRLDRLEHREEEEVEVL